MAAIEERANLVAAVGQLVCGRLADGAVPVAAVPDTGGFRRLAGLILEDTIAAEAGVRKALVGRNAAVDGCGRERRSSGAGCSLSTVRTNNAPRVRFSAKLGREPEVEVTLL